jgi:hypothetical protein
MRPYQMSQNGAGGSFPTPGHGLARPRRPPWPGPTLNTGSQAEGRIMDQDRTHVPMPDRGREPTMKGADSPYPPPSGS